MSDKTILITSEVLGRGNDELGLLLMSRFLASLEESRDKPAGLLFMNTGVRLVAEGSWALTHLKKLEQQGVKILACGTCLDFFELKDRIKAGKPTTMPDTVALLLSSDTVCL
jgi:selenium metabolism protein YedF